MFFNIFLSQDFVTNGYKLISLGGFSSASVLSSVLVIVNKNPIISVLFLIILFSSVAGYLISIGLGFLGLSYLLVYIGAISILFLFILMLINVRVSELWTDTKNSFFLTIIINIYFLLFIHYVIPLFKFIKNIIIDSNKANFLELDNGSDLENKNNTDSNISKSVDVNIEYNENTNGDNINDSIYPEPSITEGNSLSGWVDNGFNLPVSTFPGTLPELGGLWNVLGNTFLFSSSNNSFYTSDHFFFNLYSNDLVNEEIKFVNSSMWDGRLAEYSHIASIGNIMYTSYSIWLILTCIILLLAMVGSIVITIKQNH